MSKYLGNSEELDDTEEILPHGILEDNIASSALLTTIFNGIVGFKPKKSFTSALLQMTKTTDTQCKNISSAILWISRKLHTFLNDVCDAKTFAKYFEVDIIMNEQVSLFISKTEEFLAIVNSGNPASYAYCVDVYTTYLNEGTNLLKTLDQKSFEYKLMVKLLFKLKDMEGKDVNTAELGFDGPVVISFWATWCAPCKRELNAIHELYPDWQEETGVNLVAVSIDDQKTMNSVAVYANGKAWEYLVLMDTNGDFKRAMGVNNVPHTFLVDKDGNIVYSHNNYAAGDEEKLYEEIKKISTKK